MKEKEESGNRGEASGGDAFEPQVTLAALIDRRARQLLAQAAKHLGVAIHLLASDGESLVGAALPPPLLAAARSTLGGWCGGEPGPGAHHQVQRLLYDGEPIGTLAIGPVPASQAAWLQPVAEHVASLVEHFITLGLERLLAAHMHATSMEEAYAELQQKNAHLAAAVERLQEVDRVKSGFLATVSHELRTPLTSVLGYSEMLLEGLAGPLSEPQQEYVRIVMEKGEQLLGIITGILDISRIEAGGVTLNRSQFALHDVVASALATVRPSLLRRGLKVETAVPTTLPRLFADQSKIRQVLLNLLSNAIKFTPEGGRLEVRAELTSLRRSAPDVGEGDEPRGVELTVADSGVGMPGEALCRIFEPFYQVDGSSTREHGGTGLGLAIVKSFVEAHGGSVWAESTPGQGSRFTVALPLTAPPPAA